MSTFFQIVFYLSVIIIIFFCGLPFGMLLKENILKECFIPYTFLIGSASLIIISFWFSYIGVPFDNSCYFILWMYLCFNLYVLIKKRGLYKKKFKEGLNCGFLCCLFCIFAGGIALIPIIIYKAQFSYRDSYTYICIADFLSHNGYRTSIILDNYHPWLTQMFLYQQQHFSIGAQILLSLFTNIFGREFSFELFAPLSAFGVLLAGLSVWLLIKQNYELNNYSKWIGVILTVFNMPIIVWSSIYGLLPQLFGITFFICSMTFYLNLLKQEQNILINAFICSISIACISLTFSELIPFLVMDFIAVFLYQSIRKKDRIVWYIKVSLLTAIITAIILGPYLIGMLKSIFTQFGVMFSGKQAMSWWTYLGCLMSTIPVRIDYKDLIYSESYQWIFTALTLFILSLGIAGIIKIIVSKKYKAIDEFLVMSLPFFLMLLYFSPIANNPYKSEIGNSWNIYKLVQYYFTIFAPFFGVFLSSLVTNRKRKYVFILISLVFIVFNIMSINNYSYNITLAMGNYTGNKENPVSEYYKLYEKYKNENKVINLIGVPTEHRKLVTYFLKYNKLASDWNGDSYFSVYGKIPNPEYAADGIYLKYSENSKDSIANLVEVKGQTIAVEAGEGFYSEEIDGKDKWRWSKASSELKIKNLSDSGKVILSFNTILANNASSDKMLYIYDGNKLIKHVQLSGSNFTPIVLNINFEKQNTVTIHFNYKGEIKKGDTKDSRDLAFGLWNIKTLQASN